MPDPREPLGRFVHDVRLACEADRAEAEGRQKFNLPPWESRDVWQRELDMRIGHAVAGSAEPRLAEIRQAVTTFTTVRVCGTDTLDLAEAVRQILDRKP